MLPHWKFCTPSCDTLRKMVMVKLQVLLVPHNRKEVDSTKLTQWGTRKFVHLAEGSSTLHQVCETLVMRYRKLYPDDDELQIFLVQDNDMCDLDPDYLVDEVLNQGDIIRVIASNSARPNMLDQTLTDISHRAQSTPTALGYSRKATSESASRMDIDPQTTQDDLLSRPTIWNERISSNSSTHDIHIPKKRTTTTQQKTNDELFAPSASSPTAPRLPSTSHLDQSMISLPPPESRDDRTIPRKRSNPVSHSELPTKRITSGMLAAPVHESNSPENETHTMLASPLENVPQPSPTKLVDMNSFVEPDIEMEEESALENKNDTESSDDSDDKDDDDSDAGSVMSKQELLEMFKDLFSKNEAEESKKNGLKSASKISPSKGRPPRNLMKGLEIDMVNANFPVVDHSTRATRSRLRGQNGTSEDGAPIVYTTERTLMSPVRTNGEGSSNNTVPTVNIVQNGKDTSKTADDSNSKSNDSSRISLEFPPKSKLASVFDKVKKFDAKLTSLNVPRNHDTSLSEIKTEQLPSKKEENKSKEPEDSSKDLMSEQISESSELSDESSESSDESDSSTSGNKQKPRLAASTPSSSFTSIKPRGQALSTKAKNTILGPSDTKAVEKKDSPVQKSQKPELNTTVPSSIKKPTLNSLTDLAKRGVPDVRDSSQQLTAPAKTQGSQTQDESSELSSESSSSSSDDSDSDDNSSKYITAKKLAGNKKKRGNGGFAALMKDARK